MKGGNIYALAKILGHSSPKMTLDRYAHLSREFIDEQRRIMDAPAYESRLNGSGASSIYAAEAKREHK
jgi:integrase